MANLTDAEGLMGQVAPRELGGEGQIRLEQRTLRKLASIFFCRQGDH